jgi:macrolide transport system ATP-binding/permease protein
MGSNDKIGIIGDNGTGKSTFLRYIIDTLHVNTGQLLYIPQEIPISQSGTLANRLHGYPDEKKGRLMNIISRLGSDPVHLLQTSLPTPGEVRKLLLAEGIMEKVGLIIMDEPTNHMDLPSIECVETALKECNCAQLLVSHDYAFLKNVISYYWHFKEEGDNCFTIEVLSSLRRP